MMTNTESSYPDHYNRAIRALVRFALASLVVGLLAGVSYQESAKKVSLAIGQGGPAYWDTTLRLALVHGHIILTGVLLPVAMAAMLHLARACGGAEVTRRALGWVIYTYLPFVSLSLAMMLYKGYYFLLAVRGGTTDMGQINAGLYGGSKALRHGLYGFAHAGMAIGMFVFVWVVWRSLKPKRSSKA